MAKRLRTEEMFPVIFKSETAEQAERALRQDLGVPALGAYLMDWMRRASMDATELFHLAGVEKSMGYKILAGRRGAGRDSLLRMALVLGMDFESAQRLLKIGGHSPLYPRSRRDMAIIHGLMHASPLDEVQDSLRNMGEPSLWNEK